MTRSSLFTYETFLPSKMCLLNNEGPGQPAHAQAGQDLRCSHIWNCQFSHNDFKKDVFVKRLVFYQVSLVQKIVIIEFIIQ